MIYIIRHGQTDQNVAHRIQGQADFPLNGAGEQQAQEAAALLRARGVKFDRVYSSPLTRATKTAEIVAGCEASEVKYDDRLKEMDMGSYEGADLNNLPPEVLEFFKDFAHTPAPGGMEQLGDLVARIGGFLEDLKAELQVTADPAAKNLGTEASEAGSEASETETETSENAAIADEIKDASQINVLISTHAIAMKAALEYLTPGADGYYWSKFVKNCGVYAFELRDGAFTVPQELDV